MLAKQEEIHMIQLRGAGQTNAEMIRAGTCKYCGSSHPPRRCPVYGMMCGECSQVKPFQYSVQSPNMKNVQKRRVEQWTN